MTAMRRRGAPAAIERTMMMMIPSETTANVKPEPFPVSVTGRHTMTTNTAIFTAAGIAGTVIAAAISLALLISNQGDRIERRIDQLDGRMSQLEERMVAVEKGQAHTAGLLEGLGLPQRLATAPIPPPSLDAGD